MGCAVDAGLLILFCSSTLSEEAMELQRGASDPNVTTGSFPFTENGMSEASPTGAARLLPGVNILRQFELELLLLRLPAPTGMFLMLPPAVQYL